MNGDIIGWSLKMIEVYMGSNKKGNGLWCKGMWKRLENGHLSIGRQEGRFKEFKHSKLFVHALYDVKG